MKKEWNGCWHTEAVIIFGTFHSVFAECYAPKRISWVYPSNFTIYDTDDASRGKERYQ